MRKLIIIIGFIAAILTLILAVTPFSNIAIFPAVLAVILALLVYVISNKQSKSKKPVQYILLLTIIAAGFMVYNSIFSESTVGDTEALELREEESKEKAIEELEALDLDID
ncbi:FUSC family protein [Paucihalobacter sp.]|uniref:FUSC family protein n=1 Tax=Paucihalobacter sp. TaxID=2850405 RepID=UPI002FE3FB1E